VPDARALRAEGAGAVTLQSPSRRPIEAPLAHRLVLRGAVRGASRLEVTWTDPEGTSHAFPALEVDGDRADHTWVVALETGRRDAGAPSPTRGCTGLSVTAHAADGDGEVALALRRVAFASDFELPEGRAFAEGRHAWGGVAMEGVRARVPARLALRLEMRGGDRLLLALAAPEPGRAARLVVRDEDGTLPPARASVEGGAPWHWLEVDLGALGPGAATLVLELSGEASRALIGGVLHLGPRERAPAPLLLYVEDTLRADHLGVHGYAPPTSPALDAIAAEGVVLEHCFAVSNWTRPAVSTMLTGLEPVAHGNVRLGDRVAPDAPLLQEVLAGAGAVTVLVSTNLHVGAWSGLERGFDVVYEPSAFPRDEDGSTLTSPFVHEVLAALLPRLADVSFFVHAQSVDPHAPYAPPGRLALRLAGAGVERPRLEADDEALVARHARATLDYDAEILHNDEQLARLDVLLARLGLHDETLLVFTSDHGESFGERGAWGHARTLHQSELAVPWILRWPGRLPAGRRLAAPVSQLDMAPTLAGLVGPSPPRAWQGRDLSAWLLGGGGPARPRPAVLTADAATSKGRLLAAVAWPYKLVAERRDDGSVVPRGLFDLRRDPDERINLSDDPERARTLAALTAELEALSRRIAEREPADADAGARTRLDPEAEAWMRQMGYAR